MSFLLLQQWFTTISLKGAKSRPTILLRGGTKTIFHKSTDMFCFIALTKPVTQNSRGVTERHCLTKGSLFQLRIRHPAHTDFAYEVGVINSYSNRICYRKIAKSRTKEALELHAALRRVFENHCSTNDTTSASYDVTVLATVKPKKHQRLADPVWCRHS